MGPSGQAVHRVVSLRAVEASLVASFGLGQYLVVTGALLGSELGEFVSLVVQCSLTLRPCVCCTACLQFYGLVACDFLFPHDVVLPLLSQRCGLLGAGLYSSPL